MIKKIIGWFMFLLLFIAFYILIAISNGFIATAISFGAAIFIIAFVLTAIWLVTGE